MKFRERFLRFLGYLLLNLILVAGLRAELLTVATYNVENYGPANRVTEAGYRQDYPKPEAEKRALRMVIKGIKADVLVLQEMGGQSYLDELQRDLKTEGTDYPYAVLLEGNDADRHVALLSKRPLKSVVPHADLEFAYFNGKERVKRGLLEVTVSTAGSEVTIFGVHLKSRFTDRPDDPMSTQRRTGEATAVRDCVLQRVGDPAKTRFLIIGDCNDTKDSKAVQRLLRRGKTEITALLPATDTRGETWTHDYHKEESYSRVDHILVSPALRPVVQNGTAHIYDGPGVMEASDHRPVWVTLELAGASVISGRDQ
jgi:endonuclease/exonuclease/phosphatase family metal-dependent hydrolase